MHIMLLCSRRSKQRFGSILLNKFFKQCIKNGITHVFIEVQNKDSLVKWYKINGFKTYNYGGHFDPVLNKHEKVFMLRQII